ncbi:MAG: acyl-phosphate glycerol 3-phosphate acyltransferase [Gammaproteobacteria bacterium]|nr:acyl-phosphate glycerol 3-phosphate acyltransferase [Gammaproteobacteria bacterium]|tara:strand:+ start:2827 stop:3471 length:645 start_codon:yes stop_codon:yes gene_type:complete
MYKPFSFFISILEQLITDHLFSFAIVFIVLYIIGSIPFAIITSKIMGLEDPRNYGSKNPGATNVMRTGNKIAAALTLIGDFSKGFIPVYFLWYTYILSYPLFSIFEIWIFSYVIVFGHLYSIFLRFKGGKGVATSLGIIFAINFDLGLYLLIIWIVVFYITRISGLSALISFLALPFIVYQVNSYALIFAIINTILIFGSHRKNISEFLISLKR